MAIWYDHIDAERRAFIERQHLFFVATSGGVGGTVNLSPKGRNLLRVLGPNLVGYLDYPGSGNETAHHLAAGSGITLMFCSFERAPGILRIFGKGRVAGLDDPLLIAHREAFAPDLNAYLRQAFFVEVEQVQTSCGYGVPLMEYQAERDTMDRWCERKVMPRSMEGGLPAPGELAYR